MTGRNPTNFGEVIKKARGRMNPKNFQESVGVCKRHVLGIIQIPKKPMDRNSLVYF